MTENTKQPEALRLAERLELFPKYPRAHHKAAAELRRLHASETELLAALTVARDWLQHDRDSLAESHTDTQGKIDEYGAEALVDYDETLTKINAAITQAEGGAA